MISRVATAIGAGCVLGLSTLALAAPQPATPTPGRPAPPVLSTEASPPTGARSEPAQMSGFALQVGDLPPGIVAIRVIRESFQTNVPNRTVLLRVGDSNRVWSATTNAEGRAQFDGLQIGERVRVRADVGSEVLESQPFEIPSQGGVRMVLVAGVGAAVASASEPWPRATDTSSAAPTQPPATPMMPPPPVAALAATAPVPAPPTETSNVGRIGLAAAVGGLCVVAGVLLSRRRAGARALESRRSAEERQARMRSVAQRGKRDALFEELVRLEQASRGGPTESESRRREALIDELIALDLSLDETQPAIEDAEATPN